MSIISGPTSNFFYHNKYEDHEKTKEKIINRITEIINNDEINTKDPFGNRCNVISSYNCPKNVNAFLSEDQEFVSKLIWNNIDKLIEKYNERNLFKLNINNSIIKEGWFNCYEKCNFQESHAHHGTPIIIENRIYIPSFSVIYILHDENDKNSTTFQYNPSKFTASFADDLGNIDTSKINDISEGTIIIFPFDFFHFVIPTIKKRITLSYNIYSHVE